MEGFEVVVFEAVAVDRLLLDPVIYLLVDK
jgi:hypothetical protein